MHLRIHFRLAVSFTVLFLAYVPEVNAEVICLIPGDFGWRKSIPLQLLDDKAVIDDLGLSADVTQNLKKLNEHIQMEVEAERRKSPDESPKERNKKLRRYDWNDDLLHLVRNRHGNEFNELLTSEQQDRLHQIHIQKQRLYYDALSDPGVAKELGLTPSQRSQIVSLHDEVLTAEMGEIKASGRNNGKSTGPGSAGLEQAIPEKVKKILSDKQRQAFETLRGKPFDKNQQ